MKTNGEELLCVTCNDCALFDPVHRSCWDNHLPKRAIAKKLHDKMDLAQGLLQAQIQKAKGKDAERIYLDATYGVCTVIVPKNAETARPSRLCVQHLEPLAYTYDGTARYPKKHMV